MVSSAAGAFTKKNAAGACYRDRLGLVTAPRCKDPISSIVLNRYKVCFVIVCGSNGF